LCYGGKRIAQRGKESLDISAGGEIVVGVGGGKPQKRVEDIQANFAPTLVRVALSLCLSNLLGESLMKKFATIATLAGSLAFAASASADTLIAYWNFNDLPDIPGTGNGVAPGDGAPLNIAANSGSGNISLENFGGLVQDFAGSSINALFDDPNGKSLSLQGGVDLAGNGTWIDITFSTVGLENVELSWAGRGTGTGFDTNQISYSLDGMNFTNFGDTYDSSGSSYQLFEYAFGSLLDDASNVTIRITLDGATTSAGNNRIDNLQLNASMIPAPGALALLGMAGLIGTSRRRRA